MPFVFLIVGVVMLIAGARGKSEDLTALLKGDFTGQNNYIYWMLSILAVGSLGYIPKAQGLSRAFLGLIIVVLFLSKGGFFEQFSKSIAQITGSSAPENAA